MTPPSPATSQSDAAPPRRRPQRWFVLKELVKRDLQGRYAGSLLGFAWAFATPLWQLLLYTLVFSSVLRISPVGERTESFAVFVFCGLIGWNAVQEGLSRATTALVDNATLVRRLDMPAGLLVAAPVAAALVHSLIALLGFVGVMLVMGELAARGLPLLLLAVPLQVALTLGLALLLSGLNVLVRDVGPGLGLVLQAWFFLTPIVYPLAYVPDWLRGWIVANPMTALVSLYRAALLGGGAVEGVAALAVSAAVSLAAGALMFRALEPGLPDAL